MRRIKVRKHKRRLRTGGITIVRRHNRNLNSLNSQYKLSRPKDFIEFNPDAIKRKCYRCGSELNYQEYINANPKIPRRLLDDYWFNEDIELYCCSCFSKGMRHNPKDFIENFKNTIGDMTIRLRDAKELGEGVGTGVAVANLENINDLIEEHGVDKDEILSSITSGFMDSYPQFAEYSGSILPTLRSLAGYEDTMGVGTYTDGEEEEYFTLDEMDTKFWEGVNEVIEKEFNENFDYYYEQYKKEHYLKQFKKLDEF